MPKQRPIRVVDFALAAFVLATGTGLAATISWQTAVSGDWKPSNTASWNPATVPGTSGNTDADVALNATNYPSTYTVTLSKTDFGGNVTVRSVSRGSYTSGLLNVSGTSGDRLTFTLENTGTALGTTLFLGETTGGAAVNALSLNHADLLFSGGAGITPPTAWAMTIDASRLTVANSSISIQNASVPVSAQAVRIMRGGRLTMTDSALTVTNAGGTAFMRIEQNGVANLTDTLLNVNAFDMRAGSVTITNSDLPGTSTIGAVRFEQYFPNFTLAGGTFAMNSVQYGFTDANSTGNVRFNVVGDTVLTLAQDINMNTTGAPYTNQTFQFNISGSASVSARHATIGAVRDGQTLQLGMNQLNLADNANLTLSGVLRVGNIPGSGRFAPGRFTMTSTGSFLMTGADYATQNIMHVGVSSGANGADGEFRQTAGFSDLGTVTLHPGTATRGTKQFVVAAPATMTLRGAGFVKGNTNPWLDGLLIPDNLDFGGAFVFAPAAGITTQTLLAFGHDLGTTTAGLAGANFAVGTLDLSAIDGSEKFIVTAAGNQATNALYVNNLIGLDLTTSSPTLTYLDSALNIYYNANLNPYLHGAAYDLFSGGQLLGLWVPEPGSLALLALGTLASVGRRRKRYV